MSSASPSASAEPSPALFPSRPLPPGAELAFADVPETGRLVVHAERPGAPPRILADVALDGAAPGTPLRALVSPDGRWIAAIVGPGLTPDFVLIETATGDEAWRSEGVFANLFWSPDGSALALDYVDGTGAIVELASGSTPVVTPVSFEPVPTSSESPAPYRGLHQPLGFSEDGRTLWILRTTTTGQAPYFAIAAGVDRATGAVRAAEAIPAGGDALGRTNISILTPEQVAHDGTIAWQETVDGAVTLRLQGPGDAEPRSVPLLARAAEPPVVDGDRVFVLATPRGDPPQAQDEGPVRTTLFEFGIDGSPRGELSLDTGSYVPRVVASRDGVVFLQLLSLEVEVEYLAAHVESGSVSGFVSDGGFAGWLDAAPS
ncbi:MAG TPA: hypothetical protein VFK54_03485 [Candidatus Limnocylindrales bacterium]|nr:hypothetical protein [Candidatus Limnocylindrales bacterium]